MSFFDLFKPGGGRIERAAANAVQAGNAAAAAAAKQQADAVAARNSAMERRHASVAQMQSELDATAGPKDLAAEAVPASRAAITGPLPEFGTFRRRAEQQIGAGVQQANDALTRRFSAMGNLNSGAAVKQQQLLEDQGRQEKETAMQDIDAKESAARRELQSQQDSQDMALQESVRGRNLQRDQSNAERQFQDKVFRFDQKSKLKQLDLSIDSLGFQQDQLQQQKDEAEFNKRMERYKAGHTGGLLGGGGFLGTGIGAGSADF
jgi:hypothetical protein